MFEYCQDSCPKCRNKCRLPSEHGHNIGRWKHECGNKECKHRWDVKFIPTKGDM